MTTEALKSNAITNLNAVPNVVNSAGKGGPARLAHEDAYVTTSGSMAAGSTYTMLRLPSTAVLKRLNISSVALGAGKFNVGGFYSSDVDDGTPAALQGTAIDDDFFATDVDCAGVVQGTDITNESGTYTMDKRFMPLWQALGLSVNPGGYIDIVLTVHTTDITTGGKVYLAAEYSLNG